MELSSEPRSRPAGRGGRRRQGATRLLAVLGTAALLAACNKGQEPAANEELKRSLETLTRSAGESAAASKEAAGAGKGTAQEMRAVSGRIEALEKSLTKALAEQKRAAFAMTLANEVPCENDETCTATARAVCNRINYPNAMTLKYMPGVRPTLTSFVCFD